ncbi:MAG: acetylesterase, partial [Chthoniobacteraceae bacterium]
IRLEGLKVLAKHHIKEGIAACVTYTTAQNPWASQKRTPELMKILLNYGAQAKSAIPELKKVADNFEKGEPDFPKALSLQKAQSVRETIRAIEASTDSPELISITKNQ